MTHHQDSSIFQRQQLQAAPKRSAAIGFWSNRIVSDILCHCWKVVSMLSLIRLNCSHAISIQLTPVTEHLTQNVHAYQINNKINGYHSSFHFSGEISLLVMIGLDYGSFTWV